MPDTYGEYIALKALQAENSSYVKEGDIIQRYNWVTDIDYHGHRLQVLECDETKPRFALILEETRDLRYILRNISMF